MSIERSIEAAVATGRLRALVPEFDSDETVRTVLLHPQLADDISGRVEAWGRRVGRLQGDLESFVKGEHVTLSMTPFRHRTAFLALMDPPADGTWEIRSRDPNPGLRVFGRFPCVDTFVALTWEPRSVRLGGRSPLGKRDSLEYQLALIETDERWNAVLPGAVPLTGGSCRDYVSTNSSEV